MVYRSVLNPSLSRHQVYSNEEIIRDFKRQAFTRLPVMSHSLRVEAGVEKHTARHEDVYLYSGRCSDRRTCLAGVSLITNFETMI